MRDGSIGLVPQFLGVGVADGGVNIQDIKCTAGCEGQIQFTILDSIGIDGDSYIWDYSNDGELCWVDGAYDKAIGLNIQAGQGLWVQGENVDQAIIPAGQVCTSDVAFQLRSGSVMTGNPTPVAIDLQDIRCTAGCEGQVQFTILNSIGVDGDSYIWDYSNDGELCWVDGGYDKVVGMQVEPGQGLWVQAENETQYIIFPGVEL